MPFLLTAHARLLAHPRADSACKVLRSLFFITLARRVSASPHPRITRRATKHSPEVQLPHPRPSHQLWHTVDDYDRKWPRLEPLKSIKKPRSILAIHHVNDEDHIRRAQIPFNLAPLILRQTRSEVVSRNTQAKRVFAVYLTLRLFERG